MKDDLTKDRSELKSNWPVTIPEKIMYNKFQIIIIIKVIMIHFLINTFFIPNDMTISQSDTSFPKLMIEFEWMFGSVPLGIVLQFYHSMST